MLLAFVRGRQLGCSVRVKDVAEILEVDQSTVSHHAIELHAADLLTTKGRLFAATAKGEGLCRELAEVAAGHPPPERRSELVAQIRWDVLLVELVPRLQRSRLLEVQETRDRQGTEAALQLATELSV